MVSDSVKRCPDRGRLQSGRWGWVAQCSRDSNIGEVLALEVDGHPDPIRGRSLITLTIGFGVSVQWTDASHGAKRPIA